MLRVATCLLLASALFSQKKPITIDTLAETSRILDRPGAAHWAPDGQTFVFQQGKDLKLYAAPAGSAKTLVSFETLTLAAAPARTDGPMEWTNRRAHTGGMEWSSDGKQILYTAGGDLFLIPLEGRWVQLTHTPEAEADPKLSPDGRAVAFRRGFDLYSIDVATRQETRLTSNGTPELINGGLDWVYPEEIGLSTAFWWSPDSRSVAYLQFDTSRELVFPHEDLLKLRAMFEPQRYPQAGENNATVRLGVVAAAGGPTRWYEVGDTQSAFLIARAGWMPDGKHLYVVRTNRAQNQLEAFRIDVESGSTATLFREADPYWINLKGDLKFLADGRFLWTSERDGFRHIYLYANDGTSPRQLTKGAWEVDSIDGVDERAGRIFYTSSEASHLERQLYSVALDGTGTQRLSQEAGTHEISMASNGAYYLDNFSNRTMPPVTTLHAEDGRRLAVYDEPDRKLAAEYEFLPAETVQFRAADGTELYGRYIKPAGFRKGKKYPAVVLVYGGPGVAMPVRNSWLGAGLEQLLAQHGYVVWQAENRGGIGRGHAFETPIYHQLGVTELADQVAGVKYLISLGFTDPQRIGIRGWSYGGFMTVNALLNAPEVFRAGFAGAPVTSWRNYDTIYTERYMGLPAANAEGYTATALPAKAGSLRGNLLLAHNFEDDNVLFQNTLQLADALQQAGKQFEMMVYPQKSHAVIGGAARQMDQLMLDFFDRVFKEGPKNRGLPATAASEPARLQ